MSLAETPSPIAETSPIAATSPLPDSKRLVAVPDPQQVRRHLVITGVGRCGTTFLVELLTHLGLDTGFDPANAHAGIDNAARAGLEWDIMADHAPYVVKSPKFIDCAHEVLCDERFLIDRLLLPVRELHSAAESRRHVDAVARRRLPLHERLTARFRPLSTPGGLWATTSRRRGDQEAVLASKLAKLLVDLADSSVPVTLIRFPRSVRDGRYLYEKLEPVIGGNVPYGRFMHVFRTVAKPELVHDF